MSEIISNCLVTIFSSGTIVALLVGLLIFLRMFMEINDEVFRKMMHFCAFLLIPFSTLFSETAWACCITFLFYAIASYIGLSIFEKWDRYSSFFVERKPGEIKRSFVIYCLLYSFLFILMWGIFDKEYVVVNAAFIWVFGDLMAAIIGKQFGKKKTNVKHADKNKTWAGTIAFLVTAFIVGSLAIVAFSPYHPWYVNLIEIIVCAFLGAYVELISKKGLDTVLIPAALSAFMLIYNLIVELIIKLF